MAFEAALFSFLAYELECCPEECSKDGHLNLKDLFCFDCKVDGYDHVPKTDKHIWVHALSDRGWYFLDCCMDDDVNSAGYQGISFVNDRTKQIIIAHRGTVFSVSKRKFTVSQCNIITDIEILKGENGDVTLVVQNTINRAMSFVLRTIKMRNNNPHMSDYTVVQVGHSLGGFLTSLISL